MFSRVTCYLQYQGGSTLKCMHKENETCGVDFMLCYFSKATQWILIKYATRSLHAIVSKEFNFDLYCRSALINSRMEDTSSVSLLP